MKGLIQRVSQASVSVEGQNMGRIQAGLLLLLGIEQHDTEASAAKLLERIIQYRVFSDAEDKMNLSLLDIKGELLVISQFTLAANTRKGRRPSFSSAAPPDKGEALYDYFVHIAKQALPGRVATGTFGANMDVSLLNNGPVTFLLEI